MADTAYQDLLKDTSESKENGNYFLVTITDLNPNVTYPIQFRWTYNDKRINETWSAVKLITTPGESEPNTPSFSSSNVDTTEPEKIIITWNGTSDDPGNPAVSNYDRVDVYIDGAPFDGTKAAYSFKTPGTAIIPAPAGTYQIVLYAVSKTGKLSPVSTAVTKTVAGGTVAVTSPETPNAPVVKSGLASVIVEWDGKKTGGVDLETSGFAGAKVYIGTSSDFTPSNDNWVHTLNFANGANKVSLGVGSVINKTSGATLQYGTPYYIKIDTVNLNGVSNNNPVAASGNPITVSKLPASEISTGIISADASITAGASDGARVVMSGSSSPFIIYGTDGATKLLEFIGGSTGTLSINGGGKFTGDLEAGSGSSIFKSDSSGIYLGNATYSAAPFSVSRNGVIKASAGTIGGWTLGSTYFQGTNLKLDTSGITVGSTSSSYFDISPTALTHRNSNGTASGKFTLTLGATPQLTIDGTLTVNGDSLATTTALTTGLNSKIGASDVNSNVTSISGGVITTGTINLGSVKINNASSGARIELDSTGLKAYKQTSPGVFANTVSIGSDGNATFSGSISSSSISGTTITGGTLQTSSSTTAQRIVIADSAPDTISFYSGDSTSTSGFIKMDTSNQSIGGLTIQPPTKSGWTSTPKISTWAVSSGGFMTLEAFDIALTATSGYVDINSGILTINSSVSTDFSGGFTTFSSTLGAKNTVGSSVGQGIFRNISAGVNPPSGGITGDVYIQY